MDKPFTEAGFGRPIYKAPSPLPCPFCAGDPQVLQCGENTHEAAAAFYAQCCQCGSEGPSGASQLEAAELWNKRTYSVEHAEGGKLSGAPAPLGVAIVAKQGITTRAEDEVPEEQTGTRIRAFLAMARPLRGGAVSDLYWEARALIESLALQFDTEGDYHWTPEECAAVLDFMHCIEPRKDGCYCNDDSRVNATCGQHAVFEFLAQEVRSFSAAAEVANG